MNIAVMDIGSNTSLLLIARKNRPSRPRAGRAPSISPARSSDISPEILEDRLFFTRLAEGFSSKGTTSKAFKIKPSSLKRQERFFKKARALCRQYSVKKIKAVATESARRAVNSRELILLGESYGFSVEIISPGEEAKLSRKGALFQLPVTNARAVVLDIGGASTEISTPRDFVSLPIGSVHLTEKFCKKDPPSAEERVRLTRCIQRSLLKINLSFPKNPVLVATAGTPTTLAGLHRQTQKITDLHGEKLSFQQVQYWWEYLWGLSFKKRQVLQGMPIHRADVMPAGLSILKQTMRKFHWKECVVSVTGLRYGLLCQF